MLKNNAAAADVVLVTSGGGQTGIARLIAESIHEYKLPLVVAGECSSACAEYLMPSARYVLILGQPRIAFHGNPLISRDLAINQGYTILDGCWPSMTFLEEIYAEKNLNYDFVELQKKENGTPDIEFVEKEDGCLNYRNYTQPDTDWLPKIATMRDIWGLDIREYSKIE